MVVATGGDEEGARHGGDDVGAKDIVVERGGLRNIADLEVVLERAKVNLQAHVALSARLDADRQAKADEVDARALAAITGQLRTNYLAQPGTSEAEFEQVLPRLLERQREDAALNAPALREQQLADAKRRLGRF